MPPEPAITIKQIRAYLHGHGMLLYPAMLYEPDPSPVLTATWPRDREWQEFVDFAVALGVKVLYTELASGGSMVQGVPHSFVRLAFVHGQVLHQCMFSAPTG